MGSKKPRKSQKDSISAHAFRIRFLKRSREIYNRYLETKPWIKQMHTSFLGLKPGMRIVDVGCGTGDFTRYLASLIPAKTTIIGVDTRAASLRAAERETKNAKLDGSISYRKGDAYNIPIENGWADLACCRTVLMHLTDPLKVVREMARVTKRGGTVAAVERGTINSVYIPDDEKFTKIAMKLADAYVEGVKKLEHKYFNIGERLPTIFSKAGLTGIMAEIQTDAYLASDPRRRLEDVRDELDFALAFFRETKKVDSRAMLAGGASRKSVNRYNRWFENYVGALLRDDVKLRNDTTFGAGGLYLVAGRKQ